jgi:hypothetical protein
MFRVARFLRETMRTAAFFRCFAVPGLNPWHNMPLLSQQNNLYFPPQALKNRPPAALAAFRPSAENDCPGKAFVLTSGRYYRLPADARGDRQADKSAIKTDPAAICEF